MVHMSVLIRKGKGCGLSVSVSLSLTWAQPAAGAQGVLVR